MEINLGAMFSSNFRSMGASWLVAATLLAALNTAAAADASVDAGKTIFVHRCQTCHGVTGPADSPIGPDLRGIIGRKLGKEGPGMHSRAAVESELVWDRTSLGRFLSAPQTELPGTLMPARVTDPKELDELLDYLESLH
jgi:cytochrome c